MPRKNKRFEKMRAEEAYFWEEKQRKEREEDGDLQPSKRRKQKSRKGGRYDDEQ